LYKVHKNKYSTNYILLCDKEKTAYCTLTLVCKRWTEDILGGIHCKCILMIRNNYSSVKQMISDEEYLLINLVKNYKSFRGFRERQATVKSLIDLYVKEHKFESVYSVISQTVKIMMNH